MWSKNKRAMDKAEREHVGKVKEANCSLCGKAGPSEAHEIKQGLWYTSVALCADCHRSGIGLHGDKTLWRIHKMDEIDALNETLRSIYA